MKNRDNEIDAKAVHQNIEVYIVKNEIKEMSHFLPWDQMNQHFRDMAVGSIIRYKKNPALVETRAVAALHAMWTVDARRMGYVDGPFFDPINKVSDRLGPFENLKEWQKGISVIILDTFVLFKTDPVVVSGTTFTGNIGTVINA